jgi:cell division control protein 7
MATVVSARRRRPDSFRAEALAQSFRIHEDAPSTEDTEMNESPLQDDDAEAEPDADDDVDVDAEQDGSEPVDEDVDVQESEYSESSEDEAADDSHFQQDMERLQNCFAGFRQKYRLIKRIGEGSHSPAVARRP